MKCAECGSDEMYGTITITTAVILKQKGGKLNLKGVKVGQDVMQKAWTHDKFGDEQEVYGPVQCGDCGAQHVYLVGETPALRLGMYDKEMRKEEYLEEDTDDQDADDLDGDED